MRRERRRRRKTTGQGIRIEEWSYFKSLLGGVENKIVMGKHKEEQEDEKEMLEREEIRSAIKKMKERKAIRMGEIPAEI